MSASESNKINVLIIGATGTLGENIANGFQLPQYAPKVNLTLLVRKETAETVGPKKDALNKFVAKGAKLVYGDIASSTESELVEAFKGQDVVISAVGFRNTALVDQLRAIPVAKSAGVKWFVPSEFGIDGESIGKGSIIKLLDHKIRALEAVKAAGMDYSIINTGIFSEYILSPFFGIDLEAGVITAAESFETTKISTTPLIDIGLLVADAIVTGRGRNQALYFGDGPYSYEQLATLIEEASGKKLKRVVKPKAAFESALAVNPADAQSALNLFLGLTKGVNTSWPQSQTYEFKNHIQRQITFPEFVKKTLGGK